MFIRVYAYPVAGVNIVEQGSAVLQEEQSSF